MSKNIYVDYSFYAISVPKLIPVRNIFPYIVYVFECHLFSVLARKIITVIIITEVIILSIKL